MGGSGISIYTDGYAGIGGPNFEQNTNYTGTINCCISLIGSDVNALNEWATAPASSHVAVTLDEAELEVLFARAANIFNSVCWPVRVLNRNFSFSIPPKHPATNGLTILTQRETLSFFRSPWLRGSAASWSIQSPVGSVESGYRRLLRCSTGRHGEYLSGVSKPPLVGGYHIFIGP